LKISGIQAINSKNNIGFSPSESSKCLIPTPINGLDIAKKITIIANKYCFPKKYIKIIIEKIIRDLYALS
jgi:hypothetical protein